MPRLTIADVEQNNLIREVFLKNGFTIKDGQTDLKSYVYAAGRELIRRASMPSIPDGWQLVPIEPINEMRLEGCRIDRDDGFYVTKIYKAMLKAAPQPPITEK